MEVQDTMSCPKCPMTMVRIGGQLKDGDPIKWYYHCHGCELQLTVDAKTGRHGGKFSDETLAHYGEQKVLTVVGFAAFPGPAYPWALLPAIEQPAHLRS